MNWAGLTPVNGGQESGGISQLQMSPMREGVPALYEVLQPGEPVLGRRVPTTTGCENQWGFCQSG